MTSSQYAKDFKRIVQSPKFNQAEYLTVMCLLISEQSLPAKYVNHRLIGEYKEY